MNVPYRSAWTYLVVLLAGLIIAYWPVSFHVFSLKNDALNYFLPVRRLVSESWYHHIIPVWTPYMNLGYPLYGDMQSGVWNPIVQFFSLFGPYQLYTLHLESLLYIFLAGAGMFFLLKYLKTHPYANLLISFGYMLCGFASDSMQFLNWIAALAFLPFIFLFYHKTLTTQSRDAAIYTGAFFFMMFATAYPADFIITLYVAAFMLIVHLFSVRKWREGLKTLIVNHLLIIVIFSFLSAPAIISFMETLPLTERGTGATYSQAMSNPLHPALLSSYVTPLAVSKMTGVSITDPLLRNSYIGIIPFIFLLSALFMRAQDSTMRFIKYAFFISLLFSLGEWGIVRVLAYYAFPLMDSFRHPANARMFTIFFACVLSASAIHVLFTGGNSKLNIKTSIIITIAIAVAVLIWSLITSGSILKSNIAINTTSSLGNMAKSILDNLQFFDVVVINIILQVPFLFFAARWIKHRKTKLLVALSVLNNILFTMLLQPHTVVKNDTAENVHRLVKKYAVPGYPVPDASETLNEFSRDGMKYFKEIGTLNLYNKKPGRVDYRISPSNLLSQNDFWFDDTLRKQIMSYPLAYRADSALFEKDASLNSSPKKYVLVESKRLADSINKLPSTSNPRINFREFLPNRFTLNIKTDEPGYFVLLQNHFPKWRISINDNKVLPDKVNRTFMGFHLTQGDHQVQFTFESRTVMIAWWFSTIVMLLLLAYRIRYIFP